MKKLLLSCAVLAFAALTCVSASAEMLNQWLLDQFQTSSAQNPTQTPNGGKAEMVKVKAGVAQVPQESKTQTSQASTDAAQSATITPVNSERAPTK